MVTGVAEPPRRQTMFSVSESPQATLDELTVSSFELTPKTKKPRAMVIPLDAGDVFTRVGVVGLANRAFEAAGFPDCQRYDLTCSGAVLEGAVRRRPLREAYETVRALGLLAILGSGAPSSGAADATEQISWRPAPLDPWSRHKEPTPE